MNVIGYLIKQWRFYTKGDRCMMNTVLYCNNLHSLTTTATSAFSSSLQQGIGHTMYCYTLLLFLYIAQLTVFYYTVLIFTNNALLY